MDAILRCVDVTSLVVNPSYTPQYLKKCYKCSYARLVPKLQVRIASPNGSRVRVVVVPSPTLTATRCLSS
eukprot:1865550-Amphidinium_carterae.1